MFSPTLAESWDVKSKMTMSSLLTWLFQSAPQQLSQVQAKRCFHYSRRKSQLNWALGTCTPPALPHWTGSQNGEAGNIWFWCSSLLFNSNPPMLQRSHASPQSSLEEHSPPSWPSQFCVLLCDNGGIRLIRGMPSVVQWKEHCTWELRGLVLVLTLY